MHIFFVLLILLGVGFFWYSRFKQASRGSGEGIDDAQSLHNAWKRKKFPGKIEGSAISAIDDPVTGAAVMMAAVANAREPIDAATATVVKDELREATGFDPTEAFEFAVWAIQQTPDPDNISLRLTRMWNGKLDMVERRQLLDMVTRVACMKGEPTSVQADAIRRLKTRLDLA